MPTPPATCKAPVVEEVDSVVENILVSPQIFNFLPIATPPLTCRVPLSNPFAHWINDGSESRVCSNLTIPVVGSAPLSTIKSFLTVSLSLNLTLPLNVTGPSNWDRICRELPPSTSILSLTITSSNTTLNLFGSCPVTVGIGISNVVSCPVAELTRLLPTKKSPSLFIPV